MGPFLRRRPAGGCGLRRGPLNLLPRSGFARVSDVGVVQDRCSARASHSLGSGSGLSGNGGGRVRGRPSAQLAGPLKAPSRHERHDRDSLAMARPAWREKAGGAATGPVMAGARSQRAGHIRTPTSHNQCPEARLSPEAAHRLQGTTPKPPPALTGRLSPKAAPSPRRRPQGTTWATKGIPRDASTGPTTADTRSQRAGHIQTPTSHNQRPEARLSPKAAPPPQNHPTPPSRHHLGPPKASARSLNRTSNHGHKIPA